jgi:ATP-dependent DNA ligase
MLYTFSLPTKAAKVPAGPDWLHEVKYDGYRMMLIREQDRVRLISRGGHDWARRFPLIVTAALKPRQEHFVIDGETVVLGPGGPWPLGRHRGSTIQVGARADHYAVSRALAFSHARYVLRWVTSVSRAAHTGVRQTY